MDTIQHLFRIGMGPSSSHTLAPGRAAEIYRKRYPEGPYKVILYGSLAATGEGHFTFKALQAELDNPEIILNAEITLDFHPNGMEFESLSIGEKSKWRIYSVGGGALANEEYSEDSEIYSLSSLSEIICHCRNSGIPLWIYVFETEEKNLLAYLNDIWKVMKESVLRGLNREGVLPGGLCLPRKASVIHERSRQLARPLKRTALLSAYALSVSEENASGNIVVTAPTCGSSGVLPAVLYYLQEINQYSDEKMIQALATAGLIGNLIKHNASISGAEVGCQGEIGAACAMAAGAAAQLLGASPSQIEYAAEMGLEHHLGLTCDPVAGLVQIPCIERNAMAAIRAVDCAEYALLSDGNHFISFDQVVETMMETGHDMPNLYRETARGGLAHTSQVEKYKRK